LIFLLPLFLVVIIVAYDYCQTPDLGQGLEFDFTFANNKKNNENNDKNNPHLNFL